MEIFKVENLNFTYPDKYKKSLNNINLTIKQGEFVLLCGKSGCGKTTLLRLLKPALSPFGETYGEIYFNGKPLADLDVDKQASQIGFVMQNPENQIVCDKVWHELAFGLESLGYKTPEIRARVAEMASFFGIQNWFHNNMTELSGGQKQLLNLASVMATGPSVLILDEPTSQLDPIASSDFLKALEKINRELGTTIILTEHRLEDAFPLSHRVLVMDEGKIIADEIPADIGETLKLINHPMYMAMPTPVKVYEEIDSSLSCPITVRDGRIWLEEYATTHTLNADLIPTDTQVNGDTLIEIKDVWFRYEKNSPDVLKGLNLNVYKGELFCMLGGNGTGKTTALSLIAGLKTPYRGNIYIKNKNITKINNLYNRLLGVLPQNPQSVFVKKTVYLDLMDIMPDKEKVKRIALLCRIENLLESHPYDLSGGEQQRVALAKILLIEPEILLLDEPTKGMDAHFKEEFADILTDLKSNGVTILMVSHDIEFCAKYADRCSLVFDGNVTSVGTPREFFKGKSFYTTSANRMARTCLPDAVLAEDIILACGGNIKNGNKQKNNIVLNDSIETPRKTSIDPIQVAPKLTKKALWITLLILFLIPLTIYAGSHFFGDRRYYFTSILILFETMIPFFMIFESRKPKARELVVISVLCGIAVASRCAFFMLPQFKPVAALVIIAGVCFGGETGFLVGSISGFVSNLLFGHGPWTPWQMFALGIIGFVAGLIFKKGILRKTKTTLCIFGFLSTLIIYGGIMNPVSIIMWQNNITLRMVISAYIAGIPFDLIHGFSTAFFLWFISQPMIDKLERIKIKYGLIER